MFHNSLSS